ERVSAWGRAVKSGGSNALKLHERTVVRAQSPLNVFRQPAATYGPAARKPLRSMNARDAARGAAASMSLVSRSQASGAALSGAAARSLSRRSRSAISARTRGFLVSHD